MSQRLDPLTAEQALERYFFEARCKLLDVAGILDRIDRGIGADKQRQDPRLARIHQALQTLEAKSGGRAEKIQHIFSLDYDPTWVRPTPR